jgi:hypothetical protein
MRSRWSNPIHIRAVIRLSRRCKRTIRNALRIQSKPILLRIVLSGGQSTWNDFALMAVAEPAEVFVGIVGAGWL